jgi:hypothetical protein
MVGSRAGDVSADDATALDCRPGPRRRIGLTRRHRPGDDGGPRHSGTKTAFAFAYGVLGC